MTNELIKFDESQIQLIKTQIAPDATKDELGLFLYQAKRTGLDPLTRQIYCIHRNTKDAKGNWVKKMTIQTSIDGFRVIAERSGDYAGQDEPIFNEQDGKLISCKITVYRFRGETRYPAAVGLAYWDEYVQVDKEGKPTSMWKKMPRTMLAKVAEALALRKSYPQDLSGLYTNDEMTQTDEPKEPVNVTPSFFKEPTGALAGVAEQAGNEIKASAEEERLAKLKEALSGLGSVAEIDGYLEAKYQGKTRLQVLKSMSEANAAQAKMIIADAKLAIDPEGNHNA